jgi:hypothetical protein
MPALEVLSTRFSSRSAAILTAPTVTRLDWAQKLPADIDQPSTAASACEIGWPAPGAFMITTTEPS